MQISATSSVLPVSPIDRDTRAQSQTTEAAAKAKAAEEAAKAAKVFTPAPPLRPNVQDYVDINRTLIMLRQVRT